MIAEIKGEKLKFEIGSIWGVVYDFETLTEGQMTFDLNKTAAVHIAMYGVLLRCNPGLALTMEEFVEELNNITLAKAMTEYFVKRMTVLSQGEAVKEAMKEGEGKTGGETAGNGDKAGGKAPGTGAKKKEEATTATKCTEKRLGVMAWIRHIFSRS